MAAAEEQKNGGAGDGAADFSGWLTKRSMWLKEWRRRFFVLKGNKLFFSKNETDEAHGTIDLRDCLTVKSAEEKTDKRHSFEVATPEATYYMFADSEKEKDEWIGAIGRAIVRFSNAFTTDDGYEDAGSEDSEDSD
mmetsp:Transcript_35016/g.97749  ORF Transcript_35016/g.97749 Transcript_35016/m.97749 type:complete len:136 (-) Transcript_35016:33-440(-)